MRPLTPQERADMMLRDDQARRHGDRDAEIIAARTPRRVLATLDARDWLAALCAVALFVATVALLYGVRP